MLNVLIIIIFLVGYTMIALEHKVNINKTAVALIMAVLSWGFILILTGYCFTRIFATKKD